MPRIFRSLETRNGQNAFDTIVEAAVADFLRISRPSAAHSADFSRLVASMWSRLSLEAKRQLALSLSTTPHVPRPLVELLLSSSTEISAPFLFSSPCITREDAVRLAAREEQAPQDTAAELQQHPQRDEAPQHFRPARRAEDGPSEPPIKSAAAARDALRALARPGSRRAPSRIAEAVIPPVTDAAPASPAAAALREARRGRPVRALDIIAAALGLAPDIAAELSAEADGRPLVAALKLLGHSRADAMTVVLMVHETAGRDVTVFDRLTGFFDAASPDECRSLLGIEPAPRAVANQPLGRPQHRPLHAEGAGYRSESPARQVTFGRRRNAPSRLADSGGGRL